MDSTRLVLLSEIIVSMSPQSMRVDQIGIKV